MDSSAGSGGSRPALAVWKDGVRLDTFSLQPGSTHAIGRSEDAFISLEHPSCSRRHALLSVTALGVSITDLGSAQGTFVDNVEITPHTPHPLRDCAKLQFGSSSRSYLLQLPQPAAAAQVPSAAPRTSGLSADEKRKLLWGGKKRTAGTARANPDTPGSWAEQAAGALGDSERAGRFLAMVGASKRPRDTDEGAPGEDAGRDVARQRASDKQPEGQPSQQAAAAAARQQQALFADLERQFEQARGGGGRRSL